MDSIILFIFSVVYAIFYAFDPYSGMQFILVYALFPLVFYLLGKNIAKKAKGSEQLFNIILGLSVIYSTIALISVLLNIASGGFAQTERNIPLLWGSSGAATGTAAYLFANMCLPALLLFSFKKRKILINLILVTVYCLSILAVLRLGSRTQIVISGFTLFASLLFLFKVQSPTRNFITLLLVFFGLNAVLTTVNIDFDSDLLSAYADRMDSKSHGASTAGGRTERWEKSLEYMIKKPMGWKVDDFGYSHNLWLDTARGGTLLSFFFLCLFTIRSLIKALGIIRNHSTNIIFRNQVLVYTLAFMLQFFVEPILEGSVQLFLFYCLFQGAINQQKNNIVKGNNLIQ
ncbi:hypothetical protein [Croceitalea dokdonensis]|uniref:hypothetical protein n=1 Tax=Croceitalea dokdonensis TaxID=346188 RepID=UPI0012F8C5B0|nr:hypothetical protein [Croceitalea dokdonensis]